MKNLAKFCLVGLAMFGVASCNEQEEIAPIESKELNADQVVFDGGEPDPAHRMYDLPDINEQFSLRDLTTTDMARYNSMSYPTSGNRWRESSTAVSKFQSSGILTGYNDYYAWAHRNGAYYKSGQYGQGETIYNYCKGKAAVKEKTTVTSRTYLGTGADILSRKKLAPSGNITVNRNESGRKYTYSSSTSFSFQRGFKSTTTTSSTFSFDLTLPVPKLDGGQSASNYTFNKTKTDEKFYNETKTVTSVASNSITFPKNTTKSCNYEVFLVPYKVRYKYNLKVTEQGDVCARVRLRSGRQLESKHFAGKAANSTIFPAHNGTITALEYTVEDVKLRWRSKTSGCSNYNIF
jgi:hypothetical protein